MNYPDKDITIKTILEVAEQAARESDATHPEDIAIAMEVAIRNAAFAVLSLHESGHLN